MCIRLKRTDTFFIKKNEQVKNSAVVPRFYSLVPDISKITNRLFKNRDLVFERRKLLIRYLYTILTKFDIGKIQ